MTEAGGKTVAVVGPYLNLCEAMGRMLSQIAPKRAGFLRINYSGKVSEMSMNVMSDRRASSSTLRPGLSATKHQKAPVQNGRMQMLK